MPRATVAAIAREAREMLPPTIFFFVCLNLLVLTVSTLSDEQEVGAVTHAGATVGALLLGKAVLLAGMLPMFERHAGQPLIRPTLWKAFLCIAAAFALHLLERLLGVAAGGYAALTGAETALREVDWARFALIQLWLAILILIYVACMETVRAVGPDRVRRMFFGDGDHGDAGPASGAA